MPPTANDFPRPDQLEVVCPLKNHDGASCRKRCLGEKRYRSMQEHIRRAHPEHYIPKLPATKESFDLMINTNPADRPRQPMPQPPQQQQQQQHPHQTSPHHHSPIHQHYTSGTAAPIGSYSPQLLTNTNAFAVDWPQGGSVADYSANSMYKHEVYGARKDSISNHAAEVLAQMHHHVQQPRPGNEFNWDADHGFVPDGFNEDNGITAPPRLAPLDPPTDPRLLGQPDDRYPDPSRNRDLLPSNLNRSPPYYRSSTLPPAGAAGNGGRIPKPNRPRKSSITQNARKPKHERTKSKDSSQRRLSYDRKAMSAEPSSMAAIPGRRWEDLIDAAASATEEGSRDVTPVPGIHSPRLPNNRASLPPLLQPPFTNHIGQSYTASPLQRALTPPQGPSATDSNPFPPDVESSIASSKSGHAFHIPSTGLSDSSPQSTYPHVVQIYCAACHRLSVLRESYACTECICGLCKECVDTIYSEQSRRRLASCPKCAAVGGKFKPFQLDIR